MKVNLSISKRIDAQGRSEIMMLIRRRHEGKVIDLRAKSGVFIDPKMFDAKRKAVKTFAANKMLTDEVRYHNAQLKKLDTLLARINEAYNNEADKDNVCGKWLENVAHPGKPKQNEDERIMDLRNLFLTFLQNKARSKSTVKNYMSCLNSVKRYEQYVRETDRRRKNFIFDVNTVTRKDIEEYADYIKREKELADAHPVIFGKICSVTKSRNIESRGGNSVVRLMKSLKAFFIWLNRESIIDNRPFDGVAIGAEKYGTPYYITIEERDVIASTQMPTKELEIQRDIFIFQCFIGCRVSDLLRLTESNITDGMLVYTPRKTKEEGAQALQARVPLHAKAVELIEKYRDIDRKGRLFPFITPSKYNDAIRKIFRKAGITRMVEVRNSLTGEIESHPINEVASSHLARRTFVGNLYSKVADPNLIGKMSGHVDGSKAFARYRKIEDETLKSVIDLL